MPSYSNKVRFVLNGELVTVEDPDPRTVLGDYLRYQKGLVGLQLPCRQGGCGACTVLLSPLESSTKGNATALTHRPVNSCLVPLCSVDGQAVTTVEGVGSVKKGLHPVQAAIVEHHGTQCGFCTPGMVMSMYGLVKNCPEPTPQQVEDQLDGNLCRCTGYRPILDGFQTFANGNNESRRSSNGGLCASGCKNDIEELGRKTQFCWPRDTQVLASKNGVRWVRAASLRDLYALLRSSKNKGNTVRIVRGNTSTGIFTPSPADILADISQIPALMISFVDTKGITIGGAVPLADFMELLNENEGLSPSYGPLLKHLNRVAHHQVRNVGSVAGNLVLAHEHGDFLSDVATILMAAGAQLTAYVSGEEKVLSLEQFYAMSLDGVVILEIHVPALNPNTQFRTSKVALRRVNAHALLNAGFNWEVNSTTGVFEGNPLIVYGGVRPYPQRARKTEAYLTGKCCFDPKVFEHALQILQKELVLDPAFGRVEYRSTLITAYFYKAFLSLWPQDAIPPRLHSSLAEYVRPITTSEISFDEGDPSEFPVSKPFPKLSAGLQATGEAQYLDDLIVGGELHATFVVSTVANAALKSIDPSKALAEEGVITFLSADTVAADGYCNLVSEYEEVFASTRVTFYGQAIGLIVANTKKLADVAAKMVEVEYTDVQKPILTIEDAIAADSFFQDRGIDWQLGAPKEAFQNTDIVVEGQVSIGHQYHFHLETQRALCIPGEDNSLEVYSSTQNPAQVQHCVGVGLNRPQHKITVSVKRIGGAYGSKLNRSSCIAMACAFAADKLQKPVRLVLDMSTNMQVVGARSPYLCNYQVGVMKDGHITAIQLDIVNNHGAHFDFEYPDMSSVPIFIDNVYNIPHWDIKGKVARTNLPPCTYMRGPVFVESVFMIETAIEHVASVLRMRSDLVRESNMYKKGDTTPSGQYLDHCNAKTVFETVKDSSCYESRLQEIKDFNASNQWVKRGISLVPVKFVASWEAMQHLALVNVYPDGSISIHQSGCEMGQGLDTKVAQVAAMSLGALVKGGVQVANIRVHTTTTIVANNAAESGGSVTSELCAKAVLAACEEIVDRLRVISKMLKSADGKPGWQGLIQAALANGVDLQARGRIYPEPSKNGPFQYMSFGAGVTEAEVDILTGDTRLLRCDIILDCGKSLNPAIDIGQVQGAYVQGLGYFLSEEYQYDPASGQLLTNGTWQYKPPSSKDIPHDFRTSLLSNSTNPSGFLRSKFSGEPPYGVACSALLAVRQAIAAAKEEMGDNGWLTLSAPATVEKVALAAALPMSAFKFQKPTITH